MNPETRRQCDRWLWRERISRIIDLGLPVGVGIALFVGLIWLRSHGGPAGSAWRSPPPRRSRNLP